MARYFRVLFSADEPMFSTGLRALERRSGNRGADVAYVGDIMRRAHAVMRRLGLDTADTTALELYKTLNAHHADDPLWSDTNDVYLLVGNDIISFNHEDIAQNISLPYEQRVIDNVKHHVYHGMHRRYKKHGVASPDITATLKTAGVSGCDDKSCAIGTNSNKPQAAVAPSVLCVGDIFSDVFIKLNEKEARIDTDKGGYKRLSLPFGSKPPYDSAETVTSVGPSPNAAVSCARLGMKVSLMSWLGGDKTAKDSLDYLAHQGIDTTPLVTDKTMLSNTYYVLRYGADRTILVKNEAYHYAWKTPAVSPDWIYLSLLSADSWRLHQELIDYLEEHPEVKLAFQPGTFHFKWGTKKLSKVYKRATIVIMNREEAVDVTGASYDDLGKLADALHALGPEYVVITDGPNGSYASHDGKLFQMPNYPDPAPPLDRTGAGDAFASTIVAALALGESFETALTWAPINSMNVVQHLGAQAGLLPAAEIKKYLKKAPAAYKLKELKK